MPMARYSWLQLPVVLLGFFLLLSIKQHHQVQASKFQEYTVEEASDELNLYSEWFIILANKTETKNKENFENLSNEVEMLKKDILSQELIMTMKPDDKLKEDQQQKMQVFLDKAKAKANGGEPKLESAPTMFALGRSRVALYADIIRNVDVKWPNDTLGKLMYLQTSQNDFKEKYRDDHFGENWDKMEAEPEDVRNLTAAIDDAKEAILEVLNAIPSTSSVDVTSDLPVTRVVTSPSPPTAFKTKVDITTVPTDLPVRLVTPAPSTAFKTKVDITTVSPAKQTPDFQNNPPALLSTPGCWDKTCGIVKNPYFYVPVPIVVAALTIGFAIFYLSGNNPNLPSGNVTTTIDSTFTVVAKGISPLLAVVIILLVVSILAGGASYYFQRQRQTSTGKSTRKSRKQKLARKRRKLTTQLSNQDSQLMKIQSTGKSSLPASTTSPSIALTKATRKLKSQMINNLNSQPDSSIWQNPGKNLSKMSKFSSKTSLEVATTRSSTTGNYYSPVLVNKQKKKKTQSTTSPSSSLTPKATTRRR